MNDSDYIMNEVHAMRMGIAALRGQWCASCALTHNPNTGEMVCAYVCAIHAEICDTRRIIEDMTGCAY